MMESEELIDVLDILNNPINENAVNKYIQELEDVKMLGGLFKLKNSLITKGTHQRVSFNFTKIVQIASDKSNLKLIENALHVQSNENEFENLFHFLSKKLKLQLDNRENDFLIEVLIMSLSFCKNLSEEIVKKNIISTAVDLYEYFLKDNSLTPYQIINITVNLIELSNENKIFDLLWRFILKTNNLELLCAFPNFSNENALLKLIEEKEFLTLIETFLYSKNEADKKHVEYFLQILCEFFFEKDNFISRYISFTDQNKNEMIIEWNYFFILIEMVKQKQVHLLKPVLPLLGKISKLHPFWVAYVYNRFLSHPNIIISHLTLFYLFEKLPIFNFDLFKHIEKSILTVLNETDYSASVFKAFCLLEKFLNEISESDFESFLTRCFDVNWAPIPFYLVYKTILNCKKHLNIEKISKLLLQIQKLPNKFIRLECLLITREYLEKYLIDKENFSFDFILNTLKHSEFLYTSETICKKIFTDFKSDMEEVILKCENEKMILSILEISKINFNKDLWLKNILEVPFIEKKFPFSVAVRILNDFPSFINESTITYYLDFLFENTVQVEDFKIFSKVIKNNLTTNCFNKIFFKCFQILLNENNYLNNAILFAFMVLNNNTSNVLNNEVKNILNRWSNILKDGNNKVNVEIYVQFLNFYSKINFKENQEVDMEILNEFCNFCINFCDFLPYDYYPEIISHLNFLLTQTEYNYEIICKVVNNFSRRIREIKQSHVFQKSLNVFLESLLLNKSFPISEDYLNKCLNVLNDLMKESNKIVQIPVTISKTLLKLSEKNPKCIIYFEKIIPDLCIYGDVFRKDQIAEFKVFYSSLSKKLSLHENVVFVNQTNVVRINAINIIQTLAKTDFDTCKVIANNMTSILIKYYMLYFKKRYFKDSQIHLYKQRILQTLLILHPHISKKERNNLMETLTKCLCLETNQISVRFLIQWLLIQLCTDKKYIEEIFGKVNAANKGQPSTITSFVLVLYHLACKINEKQIWEKFLEELLPWTMGPHFKLRFYAQVVFVKTYEQTQKLGHESIKQSFILPYKSIKSTINQTEKSFHFTEEFFLDSFSTKNHFTLENIFLEIPKITQIIETEFLFISPTDFVSSQLLPTQNEFKIIFEHFDEKENSIEENADEDDSNLIIQQKINPSKDEGKCSDVIVIASLIEKAPNLGGLCRTCEVFGVKNLIVKSIAVKKSNEFLSLSMSSENWVEMDEVKVEKLKDYLVSLKNDGIILIGAEQTSKSRKLSDFKFPKRCALLLGNEKQGIPADLLYLLDVCLEIPQIGVTRSLNVHVAASIMVWEYTKQHSL